MQFQVWLLIILIAVSVVVDYGDYWANHTAGSPMVGTPIILVQRPISLGQIKDLSNHAITVCYCNGERTGKKGGAAGSWTQGYWLSVPSALPLSYSSHQHNGMIT